MNCPKCNVEVTTSDLCNLRAEECGEYIEVRAECECGQGFYTSLESEDLTPEAT